MGSGWRARAYVGGIGGVMRCATSPRLMGVGGMSPRTQAYGVNEMGEASGLRCVGPGLGSAAGVAGGIGGRR